MASSVSSERAFSSAGITISKRRNRLKADIVEALQCLKCLYHNNLIFREVVVAADIEKEMEQLEETLEDAYGRDTCDDDEVSWDQIIEDNEDDEDDNMETSEIEII